MFQKVDYRLSDKEKCYLLAKFRIGQTTGRKLNAEVVAREMRLARGANCLRLFQSSGFLTDSQIVSYFSRVHTAAVGSWEAGSKPDVPLRNEED